MVRRSAMPDELERTLTQFYFKTGLIICLNISCNRSSRQTLPTPAWACIPITYTTHTLPDYTYYTCYANLSFQRCHGTQSLSMNQILADHRKYYQHTTVGRQLGENKHGVVRTLNPTKFQLIRSRIRLLNLFYGLPKQQTAPWVDQSRVRLRVRLTLTERTQVRVESLSSLSLDLSRVVSLRGVCKLCKHKLTSCLSCLD